MLPEGVLPSSKTYEDPIRVDLLHVPSDQIQGYVLVGKTSDKNAHIDLLLKSGVFFACPRLPQLIELLDAVLDNQPMSTLNVLHNTLQPESHKQQVKYELINDN